MRSPPLRTGGMSSIRIECWDPLGCAWFTWDGTPDRRTMMMSVSPDETGGEPAPFDPFELQDTVTGDIRDPYPRMAELRRQSAVHVGHIDFTGSDPGGAPIDTCLLYTSD